VRPPADGRYTYTQWILSSWLNMWGMLSPSVVLSFHLQMEDTHSQYVRYPKS
jgi:hypothetical protein